MTQKIPCFCDNSFTAEIPAEIDLDFAPAYIDEIVNGDFLTFICPNCGKKHKPEFALKVLWPSKRVWFEVFPEPDRREFYRRKKEVPVKSSLNKETIVGYPELTERVMVYRDGLEPVPVEAVKFFLYLKAEENHPEGKLDIWYSGFTREKSLEFHILGLKKDEVAVMKVPFPLYEKKLTEYKKHPKNKIFTALMVRTYLSVKNIARAEVLR